MSISQSQRSNPQLGVIQRFRHSNTGRTAYRWQVWSQQIAQGMEPCFATDHRFTCNNTDCRWWDKCQSLRAEWRR